MSSDTTRAGGRDGDGSGGAAHALPHGASHWDRIPRELHDGILDAAGPLTRLTASNPHPAEVRCMSRQDRERLWADVVELDWQGDLAILPPLPLQSVLLGVRSRSLLQRLSEQRIVNKETQQRIAVRNGWHDLLDLDDKRSLASAVVTEGDLDLLKHLVDERRAIDLHTWLCNDALRHGHLDIAKFIHERLPGASWPVVTMPSSAQSGSMDCLNWVHDVLQKSYSADALRDACRNGHTHIVRFLAEQPGVFVDENVVWIGAGGGHTPILDLLLQRFPTEFASPFLRFSEGIHHFEVFKWLHKNNIQFDAARGLTNAVRVGALDSVRWLCSTFDLQITQEMFERACRQSNTPLIKFMLDRPEISINQDAVETAARSSVHALNLLLARKPEMVQAAADAAAEGNVTDILDWLHTRYPGCITQSTLAAAVKGKAKRAVEYLLETVHDVEWDLAAIKQIETSDEVAGLIDRHMNSRR
ncbi:hypothetical protein HK105_208257 [Polyrhizophydium stewartii]|uniref:Ankyrin repeat protein n=1 Tax=Polyrhizophydium stewartii TaxID=2732419 RepID=A0ABR4MYB7_9FUNG